MEKRKILCKNRDIKNKRNRRMRISWWIKIFMVKLLAPTLPSTDPRASILRYFPSQFQIGSIYIKIFQAKDNCLELWNKIRIYYFAQNTNISGCKTHTFCFKNNHKLMIVHKVKKITILYDCIYWLYDEYFVNKSDYKMF